MVKMNDLDRKQKFWEEILERNGRYVLFSQILKPKRNSPLFCLV